MADCHIDDTKADDEMVEGFITIWTTFEFGLLNATGHRDNC